VVNIPQLPTSDPRSINWLSQWPVLQWIRDQLEPLHFI